MQSLREDPASLPPLPPHSHRPPHLLASFQSWCLRGRTRPITWPNIRPTLGVSSVCTRKGSRCFSTCPGSEVSRPCIGQKDGRGIASRFVCTTSIGPRGLDSPLSPCAPKRSVSLAHKGALPFRQIWPAGWLLSGWSGWCIPSPIRCPRGSLWPGKGRKA